MIIENAVVTRVVNDHIEVRIDHQSACGHCELQSGCGTGAIGKLLGNRSKPILIPNKNAYVVGDQLVLSLAEGSMYRACMLIYGMPLLLMIFSALSLLQFNLPESVVVLASVASLLGGFYLASKLSTTVFQDQLQPQVISRSS